MDCSFSSWVDSADAGRYDDASFFSAPCSLPASEPVAATTTSQNTTTMYLDRRPQIMLISRLERRGPCDVPLPACASLVSPLWAGTPGPGVLRGAPVVPLATS